MVVLIIIIISIIILASMAIGLGYKYIEESKKTEENTMLNIVSDAATRRYNDIYVGLETFYPGYILPEYWYNNDTTYKDVPVGLNEGSWFLIDANSGENLGLKELDRYIVKDLGYEISNETNNYVKAVALNYETGETYIIKVNPKLASIEVSLCQHQYKMATCTEAAYCIICGAVAGEPLGHRWTVPEPTCTEAKYCLRCGLREGEALGHEFSTEWSKDSQKHWHQCIRCGERKDEENHLKIYLEDLAEKERYHLEYCDICGWVSEKLPHVFTYEYIDNDTHEVKECTLCGYGKGQTRVEEHEEAGWIQNIIEHYKLCPKCNSIYDRGDHVDANSNSRCDICDMQLGELPPINPTIRINNGALYTNQRDVTLSLSAYGASHMYISTSEEAPDPESSSWIQYSRTRAYTLSSGDGEKKIYAWFKNTTGAISERAEARIILDTVAPSNVSVIINNNDTYTQTANVNLTLGATGASHMYISNVSTAPSVAIPGWVTYNTTLAHTLDLSNGTKTVYVWYKDEAGNISTLASDTIILDTVLPTIAMNGTATGSRGTYDIPIKIVDVTAGIVASDLTTSKIDVRIAGVSVSPSKTLTYNGESNGVYSYILHLSGVYGDGALSLIVNSGSIIDMAGNQIAQTTVNTGLVVDTIPPVVTFETNGDTTWRKTQGTKVTVTDAKGVDDTSLEYQWTQSITMPQEESFVQSFTNETTITNSTATGNNWYLWIKAEDLDGNLAIVRSNAFYIDNTPPEEFEIATTIVEVGDVPTGYVPPVSQGNLYDNVAIGDKVLYDPGDNFYISILTQNGSTNQRFNTTSYTGEWRVIYKENNVVYIAATTSVGYLTLYDSTGWTNSVTELNSIANLYVNPDYATLGKSVGNMFGGYTTDIARINSSGIHAPQACWLADKPLSAPWLYALTSSGTTSLYGTSSATALGVQPIIALKTGLQTIGRNASNAWELMPIPPESPGKINNITVTGTTTDIGSGIVRYEFSKDGGTTWVTNANPVVNSYIFTNLYPEEYSFKMRVIDGVSNQRIPNTKDISTIPLARLVDKAKIGDIVEYTPPTNNKYISILTSNGNTNQPFDPSAYTGKWKVIHKEGNIVYLASVASVANLTLYTATGWTNSITELNTISNLYVNTDYATFGKSIGNMFGGYVADIARINSAGINTPQICWLADRPLVSPWLMGLNVSGATSNYTLGAATTLGIQPVIQLKANIKTSGKNANGEWVMIPEPEPIPDQNLLYNAVRLGDTVEYTPPTNNKYISILTSNGSANQQFDPSAYTGKWKVIHKEGNIVYLASVASVANLTLYTATGWTNSITELNTISNLYVNTDYATLGKSVGNMFGLLTDVEKINGAGINAAQVCWLADKGLASPYLRILNTAGTTATTGVDGVRTNGVQPIIQLKANIKTSGKNASGEWVMIPEPEPIPDQSLLYNATRLGDVVAYNHGNKSYTSLSTVNGYSNQTINTSAYTGKWKVIHKEGNIVYLASVASVANLTLYTATGWTNSITELNTISNLYVNTDYATLGKSVGNMFGLLTDVEKINGAGINAAQVCWLADKGLASPYLRILNTAGTTATTGVNGVRTNGVQPIIQLKANIRTSGKNAAGEWVLIAP